MVEFDDWPGNMTEDEAVSGMLGHKVEIRADGETFEFVPQRKDVTLTPFQAELLNESLAQYQTDSYVKSELARRTRQVLEKQFAKED